MSVGQSDADERVSALSAQHALARLDEAHALPLKEAHKILGALRDAVGVGRDCDPVRSEAYLDLCVLWEAIVFGKVRPEYWSNAAASLTRLCK